MKNINNKEIIEMVAKKIDLDFEKTKEIMETLVYVISKEIRLKRKINLSGFGTFYAPKRTVSNDKGEYIVKTPRFKQFSYLKEEINK